MEFNMTFFISVVLFKTADTKYFEVMTSNLTGQNGRFLNDLSILFCFIFFKPPVKRMFQSTF